MEQDSLYSVSVSNIPEDYTDATSAYKRHIWVAVLGIGSFFLLYILLTIWFFFTAYRLLGDGFGGGNNQLVSIVGGFAAAFLGIFMIKAFFFVKTNHDIEDHEVKPADEPKLFDYLHKLADEIGAPRPHKVYISNRVNASVFYDLSFLNLFWPSKKNLEIGLGLTNVLNLGELKAVLAHEFGHFAQKSMLVGRWVYIANQIASAIIGRRDALDSFLAGLSRIDIRIAWIGWILSLIVWSIRSVVEIVFKIVVLSQRALSREMEFQADLVAVSVTGSDALIHALHKLQAADAAFSNSINTVGELLNEKKAAPDLYTIQSNAIQQTARILNDEEYGKSPKIPATDPANNRVFSERIAQPPKMWATHPPDQEREANAKERYIAGFIDDRSAWDLFTDAKALRLLLTADLYKKGKVPKDLEFISNEEAIAFHDKEWNKEYYNSKYKGVYLNRNIFQDFANIDEVYNPSMQTDGLASLYPETLVDDLEDYTTLRDELFQLEAIQDKRLTQSGAALYHRGVQVSKNDLPEIIDGLKNEVHVAKRRLTDHDLRVRNAHVHMARSIGQAWPAYLKGLGKVVHYAEHTMEDLKDAYRAFTEVLQIVLADNKVTADEMQKVIGRGNSVQMIMQSMHSNKHMVLIDETIQEKLGGTWPEKLEKLGLPRITQENINSWIPNSAGWVGSYLDSLHRLRSAALSALLKGEEEVQALYAQQGSKAAARASTVAFDYKTFSPGSERKVTDKLSMWDKFVMSDGIVPSVAKFGIAASILGATVFAGGQAGMSDLTIYNGLDIPVHVDVGHSSIDVPAHSTYPTHIRLTGESNISTHDKSGRLIEEFVPKTIGTSKHYVYNIASAAALYQYQVVYSSNTSADYDDKGAALGTPRWTESNADYILEDAPESISSRSGHSRKKVLAAYSNILPTMLLGLVETQEDISNIVTAHTSWDPPGSSNVLQWISVADQLGMNELVDKRLEMYPDEVITLRSVMDRDDASEKEICALCAEKAKSEASNPAYNYMVARCLPNGAEKDQAFLQGVEKWPANEWFNYGTAFVHAKKWDWKKAHEFYTNVYKKNSGLKVPSEINMARIANLVRAQGGAVETDFVGSEMTEYFESQIDINNQGGFDAIYYHLHRGALTDAYSLLKQQDGDRSDLKVFFAASDGATAEMIKTGLEQDAANLSDEGLYVLLGLRLKNGKSIDDLQERIKSTGAGQEISVTEFINAVKNSNYRTAETMMRQTGVSTQGSLASLAYLIKGKRIPKDWILMAKHLLYPSERPFIQ